VKGKPIDGRRARPGATPAERLQLHSTRDERTGCLLWTGKTYRDLPYGRLGIDRRQHVAHRVAWEIANGPVPAGQIVRHRCDNPQCIEPAHLELGTQADNMQDMISRRRFDRTGERNNSARLTWPVVRALRAASTAGASVKQLAAEYGVCKSQVRNIISGHHWKENDSAHC